MQQERLSMDLTMPQVALDVAQSARASFGADDLMLARSSWTDAAGALSTAVERLKNLGLDDFDGLDSDPELAMVACLVAEEAGRAALPAPVAALITGASTGRSVPLHAVDRGVDQVLLDYAALLDQSRTIDPSGHIVPVRATPLTGEPKMLAPHAALCCPVGDGEVGSPRTWAWHETFSAFSSSGALNHVLDLGARHLNERIQFGKPLKTRQALEYRFVDAAVAARGLRELALFTAWRLNTDPTAGEGAALTLRLVHLETVRDVMRHIHQIHGAIGFCFEHDLALISQYLQFRRYQPVPLSQTRARLADHIDDIPTLHRAGSLG
ncbi:hypothetical protein CH281_18720 [Rhodococcus sp. 06-221-2]|nr:hypothetical protein CH281_18720 [Rhodococcus sp. 06-221-2]